MEVGWEMQRNPFQGAGTGIAEGGQQFTVVAYGERQSDWNYPQFVFEHIPMCK